MKLQALLRLFTQPAHLSPSGHCVEKVGKSAPHGARIHGAWTLYQVGTRRGECQSISPPEILVGAAVVMKVLDGNFRALS